MTPENSSVSELVSSLRALFSSLFSPSQLLSPLKLLWKNPPFFLPETPTKALFHSKKISQTKAPLARPSLQLACYPQSNQTKTPPPHFSGLFPWVQEGWEPNKCWIGSRRRLGGLPKLSLGQRNRCDMKDIIVHWIFAERSTISSWLWNCCRETKFCWKLSWDLEKLGILFGLDSWSINSSYLGKSPDWLFSPCPLCRNYIMHVKNPSLLVVPYQMRLLEKFVLF